MHGLNMENREFVLKKRDHVHFRNNFMLKTGSPRVLSNAQSPHGIQYSSSAKNAHHKICCPVSGPSASNRGTCPERHSRGLTNSATLLSRVNVFMLFRVACHVVVCGTHNVELTFFGRTRRKMIKLARRTVFSYLHCKLDLAPTLSRADSAPSTAHAVV